MWHQSWRLLVDAVFAAT